MSMRELDIVPTPAADSPAQSSSAPLTRRELRESEQKAAGKPAAKAPKAANKSTKARPPRAANRGAKKSAPGKPAPKKRTVGSTLLSVGAMAFAAALLVGTTVPANAFFSDSSAYIPLGPTEKVPGQTMAVSEDAVIADTPRDSFDVISYADQLRLKYANVSYSYTATTGAIRWPFPYPVPITDGFGDRPSGTSGTSHHNGVDFVPGGGTPIYAIADGTVAVHSDDAFGYGNHVILSHDVNGMVFDSLYAHMLTGSSPLNAGDAIKAGDFIGLVGDTGDSYGAHLHFEIRIANIPVDPFAWLTANAVN